MFEYGLNMASISLACGKVSKLNHQLFFTYALYKYTFNAEKEKKLKSTRDDSTSTEMEYKYIYLKKKKTNQKHS